MLSKNTNNLNLGVPPKVLFNQSIVDVFVLQGILDLEDADKIKKYLKTNREIENFLIKNRLVTRETINKAYSIILKLPFIELQNIEISEDALSVIPEKIARKHGVIPFSLENKILKIAVTNPADLPLGFSSALAKLFKNKKIIIELFITAPEDFREMLKQYRNRSKKSLLIKKGSLPVIYLRNRQVERKYLNKIPKDFIKKYRILVFDENISGAYLVACERPDSPLTKKILNYIKKENKIKLEILATSKEDIDYVLKNYDQSSSFHVEPLHEDAASTKSGAGAPASEGMRGKLRDKVDAGGLPPLFSSLSDLLFKSNVPSLTVDSITPRTYVSDDRKHEKSDNNFQNSLKERIIVNTETHSSMSSSGRQSHGPGIQDSELLLDSRLRGNDKLGDGNDKVVSGNNELSVSLVGKIHQEYLTKLPKEFIHKYRIVVFGENSLGELMLASDDLDAELTKKAIDFIRKQHPVELFTTSTDDIEYAVNIY